MMVYGVKASAQTKQPVPANLNEINATNGKTLTILEKSSCKVVTKAKKLGFGGAETRFVVDKDKSTVRLKEGDSAFLVTMNDNAGDPSTWFTLYKATVKDGKRSALWVKSKVLTVGSSPGEDLITYTVRKVSGTSYQITPAKKLEKGEYFFVAMGTGVAHGGKGYDVFAFGIE